MSLIQRMIDANLVLKRDLDRVLAAGEGREPPHVLALRAGLVSEEDYVRLLSETLGYPICDGLPPAFNINDFSGLSFPFLEAHAFFPLELTDESLRVAVFDPFDHVLLGALRRLFSGRTIEMHVCRQERIKGWIQEYYSPDGAEQKEQSPEESETPTGFQHIEDIEQIRDLASEAPVIKQVNQILTAAVENRASDIHVEPFEDRVQIRFRVDGVLYEHVRLPIHLHQALTTRIKIMARLDIAERRIPQDGRIRLKVAGKSIDLRVSCLPTMFGESVVMRVLDQSSISFSLETLGFPPRELSLFQEIIRAPHGIVLVTGPTGSGKTTTLYSALNTIASMEKKIITIEDPVEYELDGINQIQVNAKAGLGFASGLRSIVRQDPDVILIGEIRDKETADIAIQSALTGHLVFSTLHTNDAAGAVARLLEIGVEDYLLSSSLICIMAQRLVRLLCDHCKEPLIPDADLVRRYGLGDEGNHPQSLFMPMSCTLCKQTGYRSRTAIFELMVITDAIRELILRSKSTTAIRNLAIEQGMTLLRRDGWDKVRAGETSIEEVLRVTGQ
ncbi:GspE/PulE family protein [Desulfonatronum sp. SC1]|uniref:GspE/PulE family protein n=1 Tax=Desulfonatronum sp. SC1 TaxID=2109626 RepID=UPI000D302383|nr:GspE/PulE family protein [Desulfonatronum sp. SC1]PTN35135.1 type II secretion system protein GspE [Desulfonatronum sp. SC1]